MLLVETLTNFSLSVVVLSECECMRCMTNDVVLLFLLLQTIS